MARSSHPAPDGLDGDPPPPGGQWVDGDALSGAGASARQGVPAGGRPGPGPRAGSRRVLLIAAAIYLVLSVLLFWNAWSTHPTSVTTCGCGDASLFTWFLEWPAYALAHGHNPFFSTAMFHPTGSNLLANTSELGVGIPLAPVTWAFGPVATLNVALTASPFLSALAMFVLVRRWVDWVPAAFVAGLFYGFSPFVLSNLIYAHLMDSLIFVAPLIVLCLDELLFRRTRRPVPVGVALGILIVIQFFVGTEMLVIVAMAAALGVALVMIYALARHREVIAQRARAVATGLGTAVAVAGVLLAYPLWFALAGPSNFGSLVWPALGRELEGTLPSHYIESPPVTPTTLVLTHNLFGYQGVPLTSDSFIGVGAVVVILAGLVLWRRDRRLWLFSLVGLVCVGLSLYAGVHPPYDALWRYFHGLPVLKNVIQARFAAIVVLCVAVLVGLILDHTVRSVRRLVPSADGAPGDADDDAPATGGSVPGWWTRGWRTWVPAGVAVVVALVVLVPVQRAVSPVEPMTLVPVDVPPWFSGPGRHLTGHQVLLVYPAPFGGIQVAMTWQAVEGMHFAMNGGGSPQGIPERAGAERPGFEVLSAATFLLGQYPQPSSDVAVTRVRRALAGWGTTMIVVPDQSDRPQYEKGYHTAYALALFTAATGRPPHYVDRAWVWNDVTRPGPRRSIDTGSFQACVDGGGAHPQRAALVPRCIMAGSTT